MSVMKTKGFNFIPVFHEPGLEYLDMMNTKVIPYQIDLATGRPDQAFAKIDQDVGIHIAIKCPEAA